MFTVLLLSFIRNDRCWVLCIKIMLYFTRYYTITEYNIRHPFTPYMHTRCHNNCTRKMIQGQIRFAKQMLIESNHM